MWLFKTPGTEKCIIWKLKMDLDNLLFPSHFYFAVFSNNAPLLMVHGGCFFWDTPQQQALRHHDQAFSKGVSLIFLPNPGGKERTFWANTSFIVAPCYVDNMAMRAMCQDGSLQIGGSRPRAVSPRVPHLWPGQRLMDKVSPCWVCGKLLM